MRYLVAALVATLALVIIAAVGLGPEAASNLYSFKTSTWYASDHAAGVDSPASGPIELLKHGADDHGSGRLVYRVETAELLRRFGGGTQLALHVPALGGSTSMELNERPLLQRPDVDHSGVGPIYIIDAADLQAPELSFSLRVRESAGIYTGPWKRAPVVGPYPDIEVLRDSERVYQDILPLGSALTMFGVAGLLFALYVLTERSFAFYRQFAASLVTLGLFSLYLSGVVRRVNFTFGSTTHYAMRIVSAFGSLLLIESYLAWAGQEQRLPKALRLGLRAVLALLFLGTLTADLIHAPDAEVCFITAGIVVAYLPFVRWRLDPIRRDFLQDLAYVVVLIAALGGCFDAYKIGYEEFYGHLPYRYFDRYTTPPLLLLTVFVCLRHFADVYARFRAQASVISRQSAMNTAFQMIAHDVRKPFSKLRLGLTQLAALPPAAVPAYATAFRADVERGLRSVDGILSDVLESGRTAEPVLADVDPERLFEEALAEALASRPATPVVYERRCAHTRAVRVDDSRYRRVFLNIIENAMQAAPRGARFWFVSADAGEQIALTLGNSGSFVAAAKRAKIFEAFHSEGKKGGTGLGLAIVKKIVEAHGGEIVCRSDQVGTEFVFTVPAARPRPKPAGTRIVLVEDDVFIREAWVETLAPHVLAFASPEALLAALAADRGLLDDVAVLVTDLHFGPDSQLDGGELAQQIKARWPTLRILLATDDPRRDLGGGAIDGRLGKEPPDLATLLNT